MSGLERENEAVKLMTVKSGLLDLSQAWKTIGTKCNLIADSQKVCLYYSYTSLTPPTLQELALLMPEVGSARVQEIPTYTGARDSNRIVYNARTKIELLHPPQYSTDQCEQLHNILYAVVKVIAV